MGVFFEVSFHYFQVNVTITALAMAVLCTGALTTRMNVTVTHTSVGLAENLDQNDVWFCCCH